MLYGYTSDRELMDLYMENREAIILQGIQTKDIAEYINGVMYVLRDVGFDVNKLTQPKIISHKKNNEYTLVLLYRASIKNKSGDTQLIKRFSKLIDKRIYSINEYVGRASKESNSADIAVKEWIESRALCIINFRGNGKTKKLYANVMEKDNSTLKICVSDNTENGTKLTILTSVQSNKLLMDIIEKTNSVVFESCKMVLDEVTLASKNKAWTLKFKAEHSLSGIRLVKV